MISAISELGAEHLRCFHSDYPSLKLIVSRHWILTCAENSRARIERRPPVTISSEVYPPLPATADDDALLGTNSLGHGVPTVRQSAYQSSTDLEAALASPSSRLRSNSNTSSSSSPGPRIRLRSSSFHDSREARLSVWTSPARVIASVVARVKRRPGTSVAVGVVLLVLVSLGSLSKARNDIRREHWKWATPASMDVDVSKLRPNTYNQGPPSPDSDSGGAYVKPTKQQLQDYVGSKPKFLVKDSWAVYGSVETGLASDEVLMG